MALKFSDRLFDVGLDCLDTEADRVDICSTEPDTYTEATSTYSLGYKAITRGSVCGSPGDGTPSGRKVTMAAVVGGEVTATGDAAFLAISDTTNTRLLLTAPLADTYSVLDGNLFGLSAVDFTFLDPDSGVPLATYEETLTNCTTADTQTGDIPGTDQGDTFTSGGSSTSFIRTVLSSGLIEHHDGTPGITNILTLWDEGDLGITTADTTFEITIRTSSDWTGWNSGGRFQIYQPSTGYKIMDHFTVQADLFVVNNGTSHYKSDLHPANSTTYVLKFVINWGAETFSMYIDDTLYTEYTDIAFMTGWANSNAVLQSRCREYCPGGYTTSTRFISILGWKWYTP